MAYKAPTKQSQHFNTTYRNIVGRNMLRVFGQPDAKCCDMLCDVGSSPAKVLSIRNICLTRKLKLTTDGQIFAFLTYFEKLSRHSQSFAQINFYRNL